MYTANQDPVATIMGPGFASVGGVPGGTNTLLEVHERLARERARGAEGKTGDELDSSFRLMLLINNLDVKMLHSSVKQMGKWVIIYDPINITLMYYLIIICYF